MASAAQMTPSHGPRKSILELAPLELDCMNVLWSLGEATVQQIREALIPSRPRAYTTIMTIMDRLARKTVVARQKHGRAYVYRPQLTAEEARGHAVQQVVKGFFDGSPEALAAHLSSAAGASASNALRPIEMPLRVTESALRPAAGATRNVRRAETQSPAAAAAAEEKSVARSKLDASLL